MTDTTTSAPASPTEVPPGLGSGAVVATADGPSVVALPVVPLGVPLDYPAPESPDYWLRLPDLVGSPSLLPFVAFIDPKRLASPTAAGHSLADLLADLDARRLALATLGDEGLALLERREAARAEAAAAGADAILSGKGKAPAPFDADAWRLAIARKAEEAAHLVDEARAVVRRTDSLLSLLAPGTRPAILDRLAATRAEAVETAARLESAVLTDADLRALLDAADRIQGVRDDHRASVLGRLVADEVIRNRRRGAGALAGLVADAQAVTTTPDTLAMLRAWTWDVDSRADVRAASAEDVLAYVRRLADEVTA